MQARRATAGTAQKVSSKVFGTQDDIYDIPTSRETTPTSAEHERPQTDARASNENGKKRTHHSAFRSASAMKLQQVTRPRTKPSVELKVASKDTNKQKSAQAPKRTQTPRSTTDASQAISTGPLLPPIPLRASENAALSIQNCNSLAPNPSPPRRRRLIDALAAQKSDSPGSDTDSESSLETRSSNQKVHLMQTIEDAGRITPSHQIRFGATRTPDRRAAPAKNGKTILTYSSSRSFIGASQNLNDASTGQLANESADPFATPITPPAVEYDFDDEMDGPRVGIQSVHELRRAGANNRFSDEMDDLLSRIGDPEPAPSTLRRNALCELAIKLQRKEFASQFRDHAARDNTVKGIGAEKDFLSGFVLVAALVIFLSFSPAPHLLRQVTTERVGKLLHLLFQEQEDVEVISSKKHMNLSRTTMVALSSVKLSVLQMDIWHEQKPSVLTPRTLALQLLLILSRHADIQCLEKLTGDIESDIASMAQAYSDQRRLRHIDYILIILALESQSNVRSLESKAYATVVRGCLGSSLEGWLEQDNFLDSTTLKLAINITNSEAGASIFNDRYLLSGLITSIAQGLSRVRNDLQRETFQNKLYDELLLILGIVINIIEHCPSARTSVDRNSLVTATALWLNNLSFTNDADSVSKSKIGVAVGYLAIVLGYLYLTPSGRSQMRSCQGWMGTSFLVNSIEEFLQISKTIGNRTNELETLVNDLRMQQKTTQM